MLGSAGKGTVAAACTWVKKHRGILHISSLAGLTPRVKGYCVRIAQAFLKKLSSQNNEGASTSTASTPACGC